MQLLNETKNYRVESEPEAIKLIQDAKDGQGPGGYEIKKSSYVMKTRKEKKVVVEVWWVVSITYNYDIDDGD